MRVREPVAGPAGAGPRPGLVLMPWASPAAGAAAAAAQARVRHALVRAVQAFLDGAGFTEVDRAPDAGLAAQLARTCWVTWDGVVGGLLASADGAALVDLLERGLLAALHGTLNRAGADLQALGVDLDRLKYLRLPVRRIRQEDAARCWAAGRSAGGAGAPGRGGDLESVLLADAAEPILLLEYSAGDPAGRPAGPHLHEGRLLLPEAGCVATITAGGRFDLDVPALLRFLCLTRVAVLARPAPAGPGI